jgi:hypothetical protein
MTTAQRQPPESSHPMVRQRHRVADLQFALMGFRIDHPHAAGRDGDVVDVGAGRSPARISPRAIMQQLDVVAGELIERGAKARSP